MSIQKRNILFCAFLGFVFLAGLASTFGAKPDDKNLNKFDQMLERLERIEGIVEGLAGPQVSATFCISQGRGAELSAAFGAEFEVEVKLGGGWTSALYATATPELDIPFLIPNPIFPFIPIPVPTETKIELKGGLGRGTDICVELPVSLSPEDQARLEQIATDINSNTTDEDPGKFQRRAGRILQYADRRVPPLRQTLAANSLADFQAEQDMSSEFDRSDMAGDSLLDNGFGSMSEGLDIFRDGNIRELLATLEMPFEVVNFMNDPERIFNGLPDLRGGGGPLFCNDAGISGAMRSRNERLDRFCSRIEDLPSFDKLRKVPNTIDTLSDEVVDAIAQVLVPVLDNAGETADQTKSRFCDSRIGLRDAFDRYCGR